MRGLEGKSSVIGEGRLLIRNSRVWAKGEGSVSSVRIAGG